jgi:hypothetical protein
VCNSLVGLVTFVVAGEIILTYYCEVFSVQHLSQRSSVDMSISSVEDGTFFLCVVACALVFL